MPGGKPVQQARSDVKDAHAAEVSTPVSSLSTLSHQHAPLLAVSQPLPVEHKVLHDRMDGVERAIGELRSLMIGGASFVGHGTQRSAVDESALAVDKEADAVLDSLPHADVRSAPRSTLLTGIRLAHTVNTDGKSASRVSAPQSSSSARAVTVPDDTDQSLDDDRLRMVRAMTDIFRARPARVPIQEQTLAPSVIASVKAKKGKFAAHAERKWSSGARKVEAMVLAKFDVGNVR